MNRQLFLPCDTTGQRQDKRGFLVRQPFHHPQRCLGRYGGVATQSVTEDFLTSIRLNAKGWQIRYHNEVLAYGIAPQSLNAFNVQRLRWAQGSMKIFFSGDNPLLNAD